MTTEPITEAKLVELETLTNLPYLPSREEEIASAVRALISEVRRLRAELKKARSNPSLDQALNEGDGTYRP